ncbi:MAG: (2Fe-2S)-binding protein [Phycisphaeraceae bacterium]|nr:(2Fe-2S)-binding protein [Phycisphaerales bacterium]MCB9861661.1 (2Fe-2S)-binding protein [Phycisphaeraceae bacterium]
MSGVNPTGCVTRCVCQDVLFAEVLHLHNQGIDIKTIQSRTRFGTGCGTCVPYIELALQTGKAVLPVLSPAEDQRLRAAADARFRAENQNRSRC